MFERKYRGQYTTSSLRKVFQVSLLNAGIKKKVSLHSLQHSFATHLLESRVDLSYIQELLGHSSSKMTENYTHITHKRWVKIQSPLEKLDI